MKFATGCLGLVVASVIAVPTAVAVSESFLRAGERLQHPNARYQLTYEQDGQYYIADHELTYDDCQRTLASTANDPDSFPRNAQGRYTCDRQPEGR